MTVTLSTTPTYLVAGQLAHVSFVASTGNFLRGYITDAPLDSEFRKQLTDTGASRLPAFEVDADKPWDVTLDMGGVYSIQIEEITKGSNFGGGYQDSPDGYPSEAILSTSNVTLSVGQKVTQKIGFGADLATLTLFVVGAHVRPSTLAQQGFTSPLISEAATPKAKTASLSAAVIAATTALADQTTTALLGDPAAIFSNVSIVFDQHIQSVVRHSAADGDNRPSSSDLLSTPTTPEALKRAVTKLLGLLDRHIRNDNGGTTASPGGTGSAAYHVGGLADWASIPLSTSAGDVRDTFSALADLRRAYESHIANTTVHNGSPFSHAPSTAPPLLSLHRLFLTELAAQSPTAPASVNSGVTALVHGAGFEES